MVIKWLIKAWFAAHNVMGFFILNILLIWDFDVIWSMTCYIYVCTDVSWVWFSGPGNGYSRSSCTEKFWRGGLGMTESMQCKRGMWRQQGFICQWTCWKGRICMWKVIRFDTITTMAPLTKGVKSANILWIQGTRQKLSQSDKKTTG